MVTTFSQERLHWPQPVQRARFALECPRTRTRRAASAAPYPIRSPPWPSPSSPIPPPTSPRRSSTSSTCISSRSTFMVDGEEHHSYLKGHKTDLKQFYTMMREGKVITTSLPNLKDSRELLEGASSPRARTCSTSGSPAGFPAPTRPSTFCWRSWPTPTPAARCSRWTPWPPPWAKGLLVWYAAKMREEGAGITGGSRLAGGQQAASGPLVHGGRPHVPVPRRPRLAHDAPGPAPF